MTDDDRLGDPEVTPEEESFDTSLRPRTLDDFIGQDSVRQQLGIFLEAARQREEALDHVLLAGPPGLGKTSLAIILASEMGVEITITSGPVLERNRREMIVEHPDTDRVVVAVPGHGVDQCLRSGNPAQPQACQGKGLRHASGADASLVEIGHRLGRAAALLVGAAVDLVR